MTREQYQRYCPEFKLHALNRASEDGVTEKDVCQELGMSRRQLLRWRLGQGWSWNARIDAIIRGEHG